jgi:alpha-tubulin suppressor-like RCC1 family protein
LESPKGVVFGWGMNNNGPCGIVDDKTGKNPDIVQTPTQIKALSNTGASMKGISCGLAHSCFLDAEGFVYTCGWNN